VALEKLIVNDENKDISAGIINIGAETIDLSIYENGSICYTNCIPLGGNSITKDIMTCLSISFAEAEKVKFQYTGESPNILDINSESQEASTTRYNSGMINEIIEARAEELLSFALEEINSKKRLKEFDSIFITGSGIIHFKDIIARFEEELEKPIISIENNMMGAGNSIYSVPVGMLRVVIDTIRIKSNKDSDSLKKKNRRSNKGIVGKLKQFIENFI
jgi:cell division protein FtsA